MSIKNFNTQSTHENDEKSKELFYHDINCPDNTLLKQYKYDRNWQDNPIKFNYKYSCQDNSNKHNDFIKKETQLDDYGDGYYMYIDRHNIECPPSHAISQLQLTGQIDKDPKQIQYKYRCTNANINDIKHYNTEVNDEGNSMVYLHNHDIKCPDNTVLTSVKLNRTQDQNGRWNKIKFDYTCGDMSKTQMSKNFTIDPDNYYFNSNKLDKDEFGNPTLHIKSHIQTLILYYGNYTNNIDFNIITSDVGMLATNIIEPILDHIRLSDPQYKRQDTQSEIWCPLIFKALEFSGKKIKKEWTLFDPAQHILDKNAILLSTIPGWVEYADYILTQYNDIGFENSFDNHVLQNESKKIKLNLRLQHANNIDNKQDGHLDLEIQNICVFYPNGKIKDKDVIDFHTNLKAKLIFDEAARFNGHEDTYSIIYVPLIWKALKVCGYHIPDEWTIYKKTDKQNQVAQDTFNSFVTRLSRIHGWAEFALYCILDYVYTDKYNNKSVLWKYFSHYTDIINIITSYNYETNLTIIEQIKLLYKLNEHSLMGGNNYKQKYIKYKQKYLELKRNI